MAVGTDRIPREDASFDVVTMIDVAYHIVDADLWRNAVAEMGRILKPDGQIVVTDGLGGFRPARGACPAPFARGMVGGGAGSGSPGRPDWPAVQMAVTSARHPGMAPPTRHTRGALEFGLERIAPIPPHMRWAVLVKA